MNNYFVNRYGAIKEVDFSDFIEQMIKGKELAANDWDRWGRDWENVFWMASERNKLFTSVLYINVGKSDIFVDKSDTMTYNI